MKILLILIAGVVWVGSIWAQRTVPPDRDALLKGEGMGLAMAAERNGFPGPKHVLDLRDTLGLDAGQVRTAEALVARVKSGARELGERIVQAEEELEKMFAGGRAKDTLQLRETLDAIAQMRGRLRLIHLQAHVDMKNALTPHQINLYTRLRGHENPRH